MRIFGKKTVIETDKNTYVRHFPFRESAISVKFTFDTNGNVEYVIIGDKSDRRVEISEIGEYGKLLIEISDFVALYHRRLAEKI